MHTLLEIGDRGFLLTDIGRLIHRIFEQKAEMRGYSKPHWQVLAYLSQTPGLMQAALANQMEIEPITLSRHLDRLELEGLLERRSDPKDRRVKRLYLTQKSNTQMQEMRAIRDDIVAAIFKSVPPEHEKMIGGVLSEIRRNLIDMVK